MIKAFEELGNLIAAKTTGIDILKNGETFTEIATTALTDSGILNKIEPKEIAVWLATSANLPHQYAKDFGQPPINVYVSEHFFIEVLVWVDGTTSVHEHAFPGAFGVLDGSSVHTQYRFELRRELSKEVRLGDVQFVSSELLQRGDIRPIRHGSGFIHALFHLDRPSISVVIRTPFLPDTIQYSYLKPHIAFDGFYEDKITSVKLRLLDSLRISKSEYFWLYANLLLESGEPWQFFQVLSTAHLLSNEQSRKWEDLLVKASTKYDAEILDLAMVSIRENERSRKLERLRSVVHDVDYRFFLALLLNVPTRDTLLSLVARRFSTEEPKALVSKWIREMFQKGLLASKFDSRLLDVLDLAVLHGSFGNARVAVSGMHDAPQHVGNEDMMKTLWNMGEAIPYLKPLFSTTEETRMRRAASVSHTSDAVGTVA